MSEDIVAEYISGIIYLVRNGIGSLGNLKKCHNHLVISYAQETWDFQKCNFYHLNFAQMDRLISVFLTIFPKANVYNSYIF